MKQSVLFAITALLVVTGGLASAQGYGDARRGQTVARQVCAECHAVENSFAPSPNPDVPIFRSIAQQPEMNELGLYMAIRTPHRNMPTLLPDVADLHNVIAYIQSLRPRE